MRLPEASQSGRVPEAPVTTPQGPPRPGHVHEYQPISAFAPFWMNNVLVCSFRWTLLCDCYSTSDVEDGVGSSASQEHILQGTHLNVNAIGKEWRITNRHLRRCGLYGGLDIISTLRRLFSGRCWADTSVVKWDWATRIGYAIGNQDLLDIRRLRTYQPPTR